MSQIMVVCYMTTSVLMLITIVDESMRLQKKVIRENEHI